MPVSHLGLTVSHIPSATSFYLAALQPLGYRYIGQSGDSIGLGVTEADLFLTQEPRGVTVSPTHIAFTADSRLTVRNCYAAALNNGAYPSGAPGFCNGEGTAFNAAVEDLDGNVVEFIWRDSLAAEADEAVPEAAPSENSRVLSWQKDVAGSGLHDETESVSSRASRTKSRAQTALELVSRTSRSTRSASEAPPSQGLRRARTEPIAPTNDFPSKAFLGTLMGVAAAGAFCYAMGKTEQDNAREEAAYSASRWSRSARRQSVDGPSDAKSHRNYSVTESRAPRSHRNFSTTESYASRRYPPRSMRTIEPSAHHDDHAVQDVISRYTASRRPAGPRRSMTMDAIEYAPASAAGRSSRHTARRFTNEPSKYAALENNPWSDAARSTRSIAKRSSTMPIDRADYYIEAPPKSASSRQSRHRPSIDDDDADLKRRDSAISVHSHRSRRSTAAPGDSKSSRRSSTSTVKPVKSSTTRRDIAEDTPLPSSRAPSSYVTAANVPIPESHADEGWNPADDSDGLGDTKTVVPDDSISCIDFSKPQRYDTGRSGRHGSRTSSSRYGDGGERRSSSSKKKTSSEADSDRTIRAGGGGGGGSRHSVRTLPARLKERDEYEYETGGGGGGSRRKSGKRSAVSYA